MMPTRYDIDTSGEGPPVIRRDGEIVDVHLTTAEDVDVPGFRGIFVAGEPQFDVELWLNGELFEAVAPKSPAVVAKYDQLQAAGARRDRQRRG